MYVPLLTPLDSEPGVWLGVVITSIMLPLSQSESTNLRLTIDQNQNDISHASHNLPAD